jgi:hypothetical protein
MANKLVLSNLISKKNYFLNYFLKMHLAISFTGVKISYFLDLQIKSYGCLKFLGEVWAGQACAEANEEKNLEAGGSRKKLKGASLGY